MSHLSPYLLPAGNIHVALSGGRTSGYMLHRILEANGDLTDRARVIFANTGREDPRTLDFVAEMSLRWGVRVVWVQYQPIEPWFEEVDYITAARSGEPFEAMIKHKRYTPNGRKRICTEQLKVRAARRFLVSSGWKQWTKALGIRADEPDRHDQPDQPREKIWLPLVSTSVSERDVLSFWKSQPFDLSPGVSSNCRLCFQFGLRKLFQQMRDDPSDMWPDEMEALGFGTFKGPSWEELRAMAFSQGDLFDIATSGLSRSRRVCGAASDGECIG